MNSFKKALLIISVLPILAFGLHKYYISFTKINYSENSKAIQVTMRIFIDDLENALNKQFKIDSKLYTEKEILDLNSYITEYITDKFFILINDKKENYNYLGKKYDEDEIILYLEIENIDNITAIEIKNSILMEVFDDQQNIIKLDINKKKKSFILTSGDDKDLLKF